MCGMGRLSDKGIKKEVYNITDKLGDYSHKWKGSTRYDCTAQTGILLKNNKFSKAKTHRMIALNLLFITRTCFDKICIKLLCTQTSCSGISYDDGAE